LAVARGLQVGLGIPLYGVGSLEVLANGLPPLDYPIWAALAAGRGRYAVARFRATAREYVLDGDVMGVTLESLLRLVGGRCGIAGDLDAEARKALSALGDQVWIASPALSVRRPAVLAERAWQLLQRGEPPTADAGEPIYLARG
jgi:tRNA A37 threonylcarbamoyladenosine modification protein TsaB